MIHWLRERLGKEDAGFTLIELMVVVLIIAILIAIAIPTFLGARERAQDRAAQSDLRNALTAAKVYYVDNENYNAGTADLEAIEPSLSFVAIGSADQDNVGFLAEDDDSDSIYEAVTFAKQSASGTFFCIADRATGSNSGTYYDRADALASVDTVDECDQSSW